EAGIEAAARSAACRLRRGWPAGFLGIRPTARPIVQSSNGPYAGPSPRAAIFRVGLGPGHGGAMRGTATPPPGWPPQRVHEEHRSVGRHEGEQYGGAEPP